MAACPNPKPDADPSRQAPLSTLPDPRCDVCVFLLPPRGLLEDGSQMEAVARLAQLVPVIPVVAKVHFWVGVGFSFRFANQRLLACRLRCGNTLL